MFVCVSVRATAPVWITSYTLRAYCTATVIGRHGDTRLNQTVSPLLPWPAGCSSDVLTLRAAATAHHNFCSPVTLRHKKHTESLWPVFASSLSCRLSLPSLLPPRPTPSERQSAPAGFLDTGSRDGAATSLHPLAFSLSHSLSLSLRLPQSVFCTTALPPLIHQCKSPANFLNKQVRWLLLLSTHIHAGHPSLDLLRSNTLTNIHTHTHALGVPVTHAERCRIDICSMIQIEADRHCLPVCLT